MNHSRTEILSLFGGEKPSTPPVFSGLIHITAEGLAGEGLVFHEIHRDARRMAKASASTFKLTGIPSATLPLDLCVPAEMLGAELNFNEDRDFHFPQVRKALVESSNTIRELKTGELENGRLPIILEALGLLKDEIGKEVVISGMIPGPYTLLLYICNPKNLFIEMKREPQIVVDALFHLSAFLSQIGNAYKNAGADIITIHEMGGSPGFIGPAKFEQFVLPALKSLIRELPGPSVLSVCGNTNKSIPALAQSGADAISVDQLNDLAAARESLQGIMLFGNLDPVETLWRGNEVEIHAAIRKATQAGVDAIWPGCDLVPQTSVKNLQSLIR